MNKIISTLMMSMLLLISTGCVSGIVKTLNGFSINTDNDSAIIFASTTVNNPIIKRRGVHLLRGEGKVFLVNIDTKKETVLPISMTAEALPIFTNLDEGKYRFSKWTYDSCQEMTRGSNGKAYCSKWHNFKGISAPLQGNEFEIKKGETFYLGHLTLNSGKPSITLQNKEEADIKRFKEVVDIKNRKIKNISDNLNIKDWEFTITGKPSFFGF